MERLEVGSLGWSFRRVLGCDMIEVLGASLRQYIYVYIYMPFGTSVRMCAAIPILLFDSLFHVSFFA